MKAEEAFRVAVVANMRTESLITISRAWDRAREQVRKILAPLRLGGRLEFGCDQEPNGRGWLLVRIERSGQQSLFEELDLVDAQGGSPEAASARAALAGHLELVRTILRRAKLSGYQLEEVAREMPDVAKTYAAFGLRAKEQRRVSIECGGVPLSDFALSPLPGRHIHPRIYAVSFLIEMLGRDGARIKVPSAIRAALGLRGRKTTLIWDQRTVDDSCWEYLTGCTRRRAYVQASTKVVLNAAGTIAELILVDVVPADLQRASTPSVYGLSKARGALPQAEMIMLAGTYGRFGDRPVLLCSG